ncbi:type IV toxin-antitoxin system AbiEi family antitoxin [Nocardioides massiliensis]|uniref:Transcriptional regulator n=1 Tax=Nocardioides massiliensis TaxID=1325935 RepID=A0ABT9NMZ5_9ACTN|nr:type IV toxin-antitoxin system AbiEi family antitoxin [Nocardioides massiliensis]MDP9821786.1 hypothetical protein [Nocardioides massiliensis]
MTNPHELIHAVKERLAHIGLNLNLDRMEETERHATALATISRGPARGTYLTIFGRGLTFTDVGRIRSVALADLLPTFVATDYLTERTSAPLREAGIQFADLAGNAYVSFADVLVDIRGRRRPPSGGAAGRPRRPTNLFSPRRSQVVFAFLAWPHLVGANVREVARASGVSVGQAHDTLAKLGEAGYLVDGGTVIYRRDELMDHWTAAYPTGLGRRLGIASYRGEVPYVRKPQPDMPMFASGEYAASEFITPLTATFYVESMDRQLAIANRWRADQEPNIFLRHKFWSSPAGDNGPLVGIRTAPWPLVYADLIASGDPRQREVARQWRERHAGPNGE